MCAHACEFHKGRKKHVSPCCVPCSCGQNIELTEVDSHRASCHRVGLDIPRTSVHMLTYPPASKSAPVGISVAA